MKSLKVIICTFLAITVCLTSLPFTALAKEGRFTALNISAYDSKGKLKTKKNNVFYVKDNRLYAPLRMFEDYTLYSFDKKHNAFIRTGQKYKKATSKVKIDFENEKAEVFYSPYYKETYDLDVYSFADTYFLPLSEMAAFLKSSIVFKDKKTFSWVSSGISVCDAVYDYSPYDSSLNYVRLLNDLFAGDEALMKYYMVLGYFGNTVFKFKVSNIVSAFSDYGKVRDYSKILENAVTNTSVYKSLGNENELLATLSGVGTDLYNEVYKKANKVYKLSANSLTTMFEEYKEVNSFGDESPFDNFFPDEQLEIDKINEITESVDVINYCVEAADYLHKYYTINDDNRNALKTVFECANNDAIGLSIKNTRGKYSDSMIESGFIQLADDQCKYLIKEGLKKGAKSIFTKVNKVKLATSIVNSVFKLAGFKLDDSSSYEALLADELVTYMTDRTNYDENKKLKTLDASENLRLSLIMIMLTEIEGYKLGNNVAGRIDKADKNHYKSVIDKLNNRVALLYLASGSEKYDSAEGARVIIKQNKKQEKKLDLSKTISESEALELLKNTDYKDAAKDLIYNFPKYGYGVVDITSSIEIIDLDEDGVPEILFASNFRANPLIGGVYYFNGKEYVNAHFGQEGSSDFSVVDYEAGDGTMFPIYPAKDSAGKVKLFSNNFSTPSEARESLENIYEYGSASYYLAYTSYSMQYKFKDHRLSYKLLFDLTDEVYRVEDKDSSAINDYLSKLKIFNKQYKIDTDKKYLVFNFTSPQILGVDDSDEILNAYHEIIDEERTQELLQKYENGIHEDEYYDEMMY